MIQNHHPWQRMPRYEVVRWVSRWGCVVLNRNVEVFLGEIEVECGAEIWQL